MKVLFIGTHGQKNWGDELLLRVFVHHLQPVVDTFYINSYLPKATKDALKDYRVETFHTRSQPHRLLWAVKKADVVIFGGGSILKELYVAYGGDRYGTLSTIKRLMNLASRLFRKPVFMTNIGVGPLETAQGRQMARNIAQQVSYLTVRDSESYQLLKDMETPVPYQQVPDAVFSLDRNNIGLSSLRADRKIRHFGDLQRLGLNLCRNISNDQNWGYFVEQLVEDLTQAVIENPNLTIVGLPMQFDTDNNNDYTVLIDVRDRVKAKVGSVKFELNKPQTVEELTALIDSVDIIVAARLHALILAVVIGVPVIALEYDIKVTSMIGDLELSRYGVKINEMFPSGAVLSLIHEIANHYSGIKELIETKRDHQHQASRRSLEQLTDQLTRVTAPEHANG